MRYHPDNIKMHFIVCTGRTGSTLLASMLNMHPMVVSISEETFAYSLFLKYKNVQIWNSDTIRQFCYDFFLFSDGKLEPQFGTRKDLEDILEEHKSILNAEKAIKLAHLCFFPKKDKDRVTTLVDKQLIFHSILEEVAAMYPECKFILLTRDPRDNALVKRRRAERENRKAFYPYFAFTWNYVYSTLYRKKMKIGPDRFLDVKYEDLASYPVETLQKICTFLDFPYDDVMLKYDEHLKKEIKANENVYSDVLKKNINILHQGLTEKVNTKKVGFWKENLTKEQAGLVWDITSETAEKFGYKKEDCEPGRKVDFEYFKSWFKFFYGYILIPSTYFKLPFFVRVWIKKLLYSKNFRSGKFSDKEFYRTRMSS